MTQTDTNITSRLRTTLYSRTEVTSNSRDYLLIAILGSPAPTRRSSRMASRSLRLRETRGKAEEFSPASTTSLLRTSRTVTESFETRVAKVTTPSSVGQPF